MSEEGNELWVIDFNLECQDEQEAESIFNAFQSCLEGINHTHWSSKMFRDLNKEAALKEFRDNKEDILASLPDEVVEHYYPERNDSIEYTQEERKPERHLEIVPELEVDYEEGDKDAS